jgi:hypothetical protein
MEKYFNKHRILVPLNLLNMLNKLFYSPYDHMKMKITHALILLNIYYLYVACNTLVIIKVEYKKTKLYFAQKFVGGESVLFGSNPFYHPGVLSNGREPTSCQGQVFNTKLACFAALHRKRTEYIRPFLELKILFCLRKCVHDSIFFVAEKVK